MLRKKRLTDKEVRGRQRRLADALEGAGDVIVLATKRGKNRTALAGLERIEALLGKFLALRRSNPSEFERLLFTPEFLQRSKENSEGAHFLLSFKPQEHLVSLGSLLGLLTRIHETAIDSKNSEVSREATYLLVRILRTLTREQGDGLLVEQLLSRLRDFAYRAIDGRDTSMFAAAVHWYVDVVFRETSGEESSFELSYLKLANDYFFLVIRHIIETGNLDLYRVLIGYLCDSHFVRSSPGGDLFQYYDLLLDEDWNKRSKLDTLTGAESRIARLYDTQKDIYTPGELEAWLREFEELKQALAPHLDHSSFERVREAEKEIRTQVESSYKYHQLLELFLQVGALCLYRKKPEYINVLWQYKQPDDSDALWTGTDMIPQSMREIVSLFFREGFYERETLGWEGHHGSSLYFDQYFLLLTLRLVGGRRGIRTEEKIDTPQQAIPSEWSPSRLNSITYPIDGLISVAECLRKDLSLFRSLDFDADALDKTFDDALIPYLKGLKGEAEKRLDDFERRFPPVPDQINRFKVRVSEGFSRTAYVRGFLREFGLYRDALNTPPPEGCPPLAIARVDYKAAFFESWHVGFPRWGEGCGEELGFDEDCKLLRTILARCLSSENLNQALSCLDQNSRPVIVTTYSVPDDWLTKQGSMIWHWQATGPKLDLPSFKGFYVDRDRHVPVLALRTDYPPDTVILLDLNRLGCLHQYSPLAPGATQDEMHDVFHILVKAFSEDVSLMKEYLSNPPSWLKEQGDEDAQKKYLEKRVEVLVRETFEFHLSEDFVGYWFAPSRITG